MTVPAKLLLPTGETIEFESRQGTFGDTVYKVSALGSTGSFTFDPGFKSTASCESSITFIDGAKGQLLHRGYPIDQLANKKDFLDVCYLLIHGELPKEDQKAAFDQNILTHMPIEEIIPKTLAGFKQEAHPMSKIMAMTSAMSGYYYDQTDLAIPESRLTAATRLIATAPTLAAIAYRHSQGLDYIDVDPQKSYASNFLQMMFGDSLGESQPFLSEALDKIFILHADHEQNASTSTVRLSGSTGTDPCAAITSGIASLWGKAHGGANEACLNMLHTIGSIDNIEQYINKAKDSNDPFRLMGFGHRVYKSYDPRATILRTTCHDVLEAMGSSDEPLFKLAMALEKIALEDDYFVSRNLYPNVDFYSGITLSALGIPPNMFTAIFALARTAGWSAHWLEMHTQGLLLGRPRQLYTGAGLREVD